MLMYKYLSMLLGVGLLVLGGFYLWERHSNSATQTALNNKLAKLEGTIKETETAYSSRGVELEDLKSNNKDLQKIINQRDEEVAALGEVALKWKSKYFQIKNATGSVVGADGTTPVTIPADCQTCINDLRFRVDFDQLQDYLRVVGYTLNNPAYAELTVSWERPLKLSFLLTKKDDSYRLYFDSNTPDIVPGELTLKVDPSVFERKWYEKLGVSSSVSVLGAGVVLSLSAVYDIGNMFIGPNVALFPHNGVGTAYGVTWGWYPFR